MTQRYGEEWARDFATAHERNPSSHHVPVGMDLHNNEVGRQIAQANPDASPEELANLVEQAVKDGDMVVIDKNDTLVPSSERDPGDTRETTNHPWPTDNPGATTTAIPATRQRLRTSTDHARDTDPARTTRCAARGMRHRLGSDRAIVPIDTRCRWLPGAHRTDLASGRTRLLDPPP